MLPLKTFPMPSSSMRGSSSSDSSLSARYWASRTLIRHPLGKKVLSIPNRVFSGPPAVSACLKMVFRSRGWDWYLIQLLLPPLSMSTDKVA